MTERQGRTFSLYDLREKENNKINRIAKDLDKKTDGKTYNQGKEINTLKETIPYGQKNDSPKTDAITNSIEEYSNLGSKNLLNYNIKKDKTTYEDDNAFNDFSPRDGIILYQGDELKPTKDVGYILERFLVDEFPISLGNYQQERILKTESVQPNYTYEKENTFGLKNADLYKELEKEESEKNLDLDVVKSEALAIGSAIGTIGSLPNPYLTGIGIAATLDSVNNVFITRDENAKIKAHYDSVKKLSQSDSFKTIDLDGGRLQINEYQNVDGALLLVRETTYNAELKRNNDGKLDFNDFIVSLNDKTNESNFKAISSDKSYHYEMIATGEFQLKYSRTLDNDEKHYDLWKFDGKGNKEKIITDKDYKNKVEPNESKVDEIKIAMNIFEGYDNGYKVLEQLNKVYDNPDARPPIDPIRQYNADEMFVESQSNTDIDYYIRYDDRYSTIEKDMTIGWSKNLIAEREQLEKEKIRLRNKCKNDKEISREEFIKRVKDGRIPGFVTSHLSKGGYVKIAMDQYKNELDKKLKLEEEAINSRIEAIDNKLLEFGEILDTEYFEKLLNYLNTIEKVNDPKDKGTREAFGLDQKEREIKKLENELKAKGIDLKGIKFDKYKTQGEADLNYIKENHLTDGSVLNSVSAFSLGIDGMALDQSLLNYGIDAGKLIGKAA